MFMEQQRAESPTPADGYNNKLEELELPTLDLEEESGLTEALAAACRDLGVFRLANHGIPADLSDRLFGLTRRLLEEPDAEKKAKLPGYFSGTPALSLRVKELNWVEGFHVAPAATDAGADPTAADDDTGGEFGSFRTVAAEYVSHMARIARKLFDAMDLGLDASQRAAYLAEHDGTFRAYRYPACPAGGHIGMEAHTDSSVLSILNQQDLQVSSLQVLLRPQGSWRSVRPVGGTLVVNIGDMMQAITGDAYRSVEHRVVPLPDTDRMSLCYFAFPQDDAIISGCGEDGGEKGSCYRAFSYREFREQVQADIKATGAKVGLARFHRGASAPELASAIGTEAGL